LVGGLIVFNPLKHLPKNISIGEVQIDGTKVVVDKPKIAGLQQNGLPFEITARSGTEDILKPNILKLSGVRAKITLADLSQLEVLAKDGIYDNQLDQVLIEGDVHIKNNGNYLIEMNQASLDFKTNVLYSNQFAFMQLTNGKITSDTITISKNGERIEFEGRVKSIFEEVSVGAEQE
jgi:lipopolysaccharide export system protein LptC